MDELPTPVKRESRIAFGLVWFETEEDAARYAEAVRGDTYNGGWFDGRACGREPSFDYTDDGGLRLYAVSTR